MNTDDKIDAVTTRAIADAGARVSEARAAMARGDTVAAGWWFYGVGPAGAQPWSMTPAAALYRHAHGATARRVP